MDEKAKITNTTALLEKAGLRDAMTANLLAGGGAGSVEAMEAEGQKELVAAKLLPTEGSNDPAWAELGVIFGKEVDGDPLFREVTLPAGWAINPAPDHSMWSYLVDTEGKQRAAIFYKAAFYDRRAHIHLTK